MDARSVIGCGSVALNGIVSAGRAKVDTVFGVVAGGVVCNDVVAGRVEQDAVTLVVIG